MSAPEYDTTDPADRPTVRAPYPGARVCGALWCSEVALPGKDRCSHHNHRPQSQPKFAALRCEDGTR